MAVSKLNRLLYRFDESYIVELLSNHFTEKILKESGEDVVVVSCTDYYDTASDSVVFEISYKENFTDTAKKFSIHVT